MPQSIIEAAKVVTAENWETVLPRFYGLSKREAMEVVAALQPHPAPPTRTLVTSPRPAATTVACLGAPAPLLARADAPAHELPALAAGWPDEPTLAAPPALDVPADRPSQLVPLTAAHDRLHVTISKRCARKLEEAKAARPGITDEAILEAGARLAPRAPGEAEGPRREAAEEDTALEA